MVSVASAIAGGLGLYSALRTSPEKVRFETAAGDEIIRFDAVLNETYGFNNQPTAFPIEDGTSISDHIIHAPRQYDVVGIVTDTPLHTTGQIVTEALTVAASTVLPPLGVVAGTAALATWQANSESLSPSQAAYGTLVKMTQGDPSINPPLPPAVFTLSTRLGKISNMCIASLSVPRDVESGSALVFQVTLVNLVVVTPQSINITALDNAALAAMKQSLGEQQGDLESAFNKGEVLGDKQSSSVLRGVSSTLGKALGKVGL